MKVENMTSPRSGKPVANQFIITDNEGNVWFQSYKSMIAVRMNHTGEIILDADKWDYSVTTSKYRNEFLGVNTAQTRKAINQGLYKLGDLN